MNEWAWSNQQNDTDRGKPNTWTKTCSSTILSAINPTRSGLGSNKGFRVDRPAVSQHSDVTPQWQRQVGEIPTAYDLVSSELQGHWARWCGQIARVHRTVCRSGSTSWNSRYLLKVAFISTIATVLVAMNASSVGSANIYVCVTSNPKQLNLLFYVQPVSSCD